MKNSKLLVLLQTFSNIEVKRFEQYLNSPFFTTNLVLPRLYHSIKNKKLLDKNLIWKSLALEGNYNDVRFRRLCADLHLLAQDFLALQAYKENPTVERNYLLGVLNDRNLDKHFGGIERSTRAFQEKSRYRDAEYYLNQMVLEQEVDLFAVKNIQLTKKVNLEEADRMLDYFYLTQKLKNYCNALNYKNVLNLDLQLGLIQRLIDDIEKEGYLEIPAIAIYYSILKTLLLPNETTHFYQLVQLLDKNGHSFPPVEIRDMYIFAQNYCIRKINLGQPEFFRELFEIYQTLLEKGIIFKNGELLPWDYKNIVTLGLRLKEFKWIEQFIKEFNHKLPAKFQENALTYNLANLYFSQKRYSDVIRLLSTVEYKGLYYALDGRWLLLRTYYELKEFEAMESLVESFRLFLIRNKLLSKTKQRQYLNLLRFVKRLIRLAPNETNRAKILLEKINQTKELVEGKWLKEKLENRLGVKS